MRVMTTAWAAGPLVATLMMRLSYPLLISGIAQAIALRRANGSLTQDEVGVPVDEATGGRDLGFIGAPGVNLLEPNLALDRVLA
jgi:K+-transporting ATPase c subunit